MSDVALEVHEVSKRYSLGGGSGQPGYRSLRESITDAAKAPLRRLSGVKVAGAADSRTLWALKDVSFEVQHGEVLGIVGRNGAGKSTLLKILSRITEPTSGWADVFGRVGSLLEVGTGFHGELTGRENIYLNGAIIGMPRADIRRKFDEIVQFAELERFLDTPVKRYSSGMYMRLAFSVAAHLEPEILVIDEVLAVGDAEFQKKCLGKMEDVAKEGRTVLFVSHNLAAVQKLCTSAVLLEQGHLTFRGTPSEVITRYLERQTSTETYVEWVEEEKRPGDEHIRLCSIQIAQEGQSIPGVFQSSLPVSIELDVDVLQPHSALTVGFELLSSAGELLFWSYHTDMPEKAIPTLAAGRNRVRGVIPAGLLNGGVYQVRPLISLHFIRWVINGEPTLRFTVELDHPKTPYWYAPRPGALAPALAWTAAPLDRHSWPAPEDEPDA